MKTHAEKKSHWPLTILIGFSSLLNLFLPLVLVRILTPDQVGQYKFFFLCVGTAPWFLLSAGFVRGLYFWASQKERAQSALSATWSYQLLWTAGILALGALILPFASEFSQFWMAEPRFLALLIGSIAFSISAQFYEEYRIAQGESHAAAWYAAGWEFFRTATLVLSALHWRSIESVLWAHFAVVFLKFTVSNSFVVTRGMSRFHLWDNPERKAVLSYALPISGAAAFAVVLGFADQFLLGHYLPPEAFALYSLGCLAIPPLLIFEQSVNKVMLPTLSSAFADGKANEAWRIVRSSVRELSLWLIPSSIGLFFFSDSIIRLLFTEKYLAAGSYLRIYCWSYLVYVIPYDCWARAQGRPQWIFRVTAVFAGLCALATFGGLQLAGALGALIAFLTVQVLLRFFGLYEMKRCLDWKLSKVLPLRDLARNALIATALGFGLSSLEPFFRSTTLSLILLGSLFWILYASICVPLSLRRERDEEQFKKVLLLTQYLHVGGLERMILNLCRKLKDRRAWDPQVYVYDEIRGGERLDFAFDGIPITRNHKGPGFSLRLGWQIAQHCRKNQIDLIHAHDLGALIYACCAKVMSLGRLRIVFTQHSFVHLRKGKKYLLYERAFCSLADQIVTVSSNLSETYIQMSIPEKKVRVIENGIPIDGTRLDADQKRILRSELISAIHADIDPAKTWIVCLARLHPGKGQIESIKIWNLLPEKTRQNSLLLFVGGETFPGFKARIQEEIRSAASPRNIVLLGNSQHPQEWLMASDLFISASQEEGLPLSPIEALAAGLPLFLSRIEGHRIFESVSTQFDLNDLGSAANDLAQELQQHLAHGGATVAPAASTNAREDLLTRFSVERMTMEYENVYGSHLDKSH